MADYIFLLQYFTDDTGVCSHVCAPVLWRNSYPPRDCASVLPKMHPVWRPNDTILYSGNPCTRRKMISMATTYISNLHIFGEWVSYMITLSLAGLRTSKKVSTQTSLSFQGWRNMSLEWWTNQNKQSTAWSTNLLNACCQPRQMNITPLHLVDRTRSPGPDLNKWL